MTLTFHALWMLCALGAIVFAAATAHARDRLALAVGFALAALTTSGSHLPDAVLLGGLTAAGAAAYLFKPRFRWVSLAIGGILAGCWTALLEVQGLPLVMAVLVAGALIAGTVCVSHSRASFAPDVLVDDGLLAIGALGLAVAIAPGVLDGWHAATNLSGSPDRAAEPAAIPMWTLAFILMSSSLGALYALWSRR